MSVTTSVTIGGSAVNCTAANLFPARLTAYARGGIPTLTLLSPGAALQALPDPYLGKSVSLSLNGTLVFSGDVASVHPLFDDRLGWVLQYQCTGLRARADRVPFTDTNSGTDSAGYNLQPDDPAYWANRAGRTVGQVLTDVLTMVDNATALNSVGVGNYTGLPSAPALPSATATDLAALTVIPPAPLYVTGEKCLAAVESFLAQWAPNCTLWVAPDGTLRFLDLRSFTPHTLTLDSDPVLPTPLSRDWSDSFPRVITRGAPLVEAVMCSLSNGLLAEDFAWGAYTSDQAKANWTDQDFQQGKSAQDYGSCTCPSTTTVTVTSHDATLTFASNFWDQTSAGRHGWIYLKASTAGGAINQLLSRRIVSNTALAAGGTATITVDRPLPILTYDSYQIFGTTGGNSDVWRKYSVTNAAIAAKLTNRFSAPVPFVLAGNDAATLTSVPLGSVLWPAPNSTPPPAQETMLDFLIDPVAGTIEYSRPTWEVAGKKAPYDVRALLAVNTGANQSVYPANDSGGNPVYQGTSHTVEGRSDTLTLTIPAWRDPANQTQIDDYTQDVWDSVKDTVVEGSVSYLGLYTPALLMGQALTIAGPAAPWSGLVLPVLECEVEWDETGGSDVITRMRCSNRRAHLTAENFLKPDRTGVEFGSVSPLEAVAGPGLLPSAAGALGGYLEGLAAEYAGPAPAALGSLSAAHDDLLGSLSAAHDELLSAAADQADSWVDGRAVV